MITITEAAKTKIAAVLAEENVPNMKLRMFVQGGGCSGFQYGFTMDDLQNEDDILIGDVGSGVLIDAMSVQYLEDAIVDFRDDLEGARFSIENPQAKSTCGCGSSFST
jgi:iron-sulfur cluster insertion protein